MPDEIPVRLRSVQRPVAHPLEGRPANRKTRPVRLGHRLRTSSSPSSALAWSGTLSGRQIRCRLALFITTGGPIMRPGAASRSEGRTRTESTVRGARGSSRRDDRPLPGVLRVGHVDPDDRVRHRHQPAQPPQPRVRLRLRSPRRGAASGGVLSRLSPGGSNSPGRSPTARRPTPRHRGRWLRTGRAGTVLGFTLAVGRERFHGPGWSPWSPWSPTVRCGARSRRTAR